MTTEEAIRKLSNRAEYALHKADTPDKRSKAEQLVDATNEVIEYYNRTESNTEEVRIKGDLLNLFAEYLCLDERDIKDLMGIPVSYIRDRLIKYRDRYMKPRDHFQQVVFDYDTLCQEQKTLDDLRFQILPMIKATDNKELAEMIEESIKESEDLINELRE